MPKINFVVTGKYSLGVQGNNCTPNCGYELNVTKATVEAVKSFQENGYLTLNSIDGVPYIVNSPEELKVEVDIPEVSLPTEEVKEIEALDVPVESSPVKSRKYKPTN